MGRGPKSRNGFSRQPLNDPNFHPKRLVVTRSETRKAKRDERRAMLISMAGGKCNDCDYGYGDYMFDFHHVNPELKSFKLCGAALEASWERLVQEAAKCVLLCPNCHRTRHAKLEGIIQ